MLPFEEARAFVHTLKLGDKSAWEKYGKSGKRPYNIPAGPQKVYRDTFVSWPDWLGFSYLPFEEARSFVRSLHLKGQKGWHAWRKSSKRPSNIPSAPDRAYGNAFISTADWLGDTTSRCPQARRIDMLPFAEARAIVREMKFTCQTDYQKWSKSGKRPSNIPSDPCTTYRKTVWKSHGGWKNWLGLDHHHCTPPYRCRGPGAGLRACASCGCFGYHAWIKCRHCSSSFKLHPADSSRKREREASDSDSEPAVQPARKIKVEEIDGFSIVSAAGDLAHTACGLLQQGPPLS
jgi:hypothetical protein